MQDIFGRRRRTDGLSRTNPTSSENAKRKTKMGGKNEDSSGSVMLYRGRPPTPSETGAKAHLSRDIDLIVVDESNSFSSNRDGDSRRYLTIVCTRVRDRNGYAEIIRLVPHKKGVRGKYSNTHGDDLNAIAKAIAAQDIAVVERHGYIDYRALNTPEKKKKFYLGVLRDAVTDAVELDDRETDVILDTPPIPMDEEIIELGENLVESGHNIRWFEVRSSAGDRFLTVHDYETGIVSDHVEGIEKGSDLYEGHLKWRMRNVKQPDDRRTHGRRWIGVCADPSIDSGLAL